MLLFTCRALLVGLVLMLACLFLFGHQAYKKVVREVEEVSYDARK